MKESKSKKEKLTRKDVKTQLDKLIKEFNKPSPLKTSKKPEKPVKEAINNLQEVIDYLRVCIKYTVWDLEATRRENAYLRGLLEGK